MRIPIALVLAVALVACGRSDTKTEATPPPVSAQPPGAAPEAVRVGDVMLGSAIGADKRVTTPTTSFAPGDTIYASVATVGSAPSLTLVARWTYEDGQLVSESSQTIAPTGPAATEFHIAKPDGFPAGRYQLEIRVGDELAQARSFEVH